MIYPVNQTLKASEQRINHLLLLQESMRLFAPIESALSDMSANLLLYLREVFTSHRLVQHFRI